MDNITDTTYYKGEITIPFSNKDTADFTKNFIQIYEEELLVKCLGRELFDLFSAEVDSATFTPRFMELMFGKLYTVELEGKTLQVRWEGLQNQKKVSPLSHYVCVKWVEFNFNQMTGLGNSYADKENAQTAEVRNKLVQVYKTLARLVGYYPFQSDLVVDVIYPEDVHEDILQKLEASLFNFLYFNREQFPEWVWQNPDVHGVNHFDL